MSIEKSFEEYMNEKVPTWQNSISEQTIEGLRGKYSNVQKYMKIVDNIFDMALNHNKSGIDYSTDLVKANENLALSQLSLEMDIKAIREVMGLDVKEQEQETIGMTK